MPIYVSLWLYSQSYNPMIYIYIPMIILSPSPSLYHRATRHAPNAKRASYLRCPWILSRRTRVASWIPSKSGLARGGYPVQRNAEFVKKPWEMGCFNEGKWRLMTIKWWYDGIFVAKWGIDHHQITIIMGLTKENATLSLMINPQYALTKEHGEHQP